MAGNTSDYQNKRDFRHTPEPPARRPKQPRRSKSVFVVHRHEARRLHYDLRLEVNGVLKSWAIPKGFSFDPKVKHLAIHTEDHPIEYEAFEGVIPKDQYGAGTMTIWDRGKYQLLGGVDAEQSIAAGKLELTLDGGRLRGEWHMVRTAKSKTEWLLFKSRDVYARSSDEPIFPLDLSRAKREGFPASLTPMKPAKTVAPFLESHWLYEPKLPGVRLLLEKRKQTVRLLADEKNVIRRLPRILEDAAKLRAERAIVDGILVCLDRDQRPSYEAALSAISGDVVHPYAFYVFDLLFYDHWDLRSHSIIERKAALKSLLPDRQHIILVQHERFRARELMASVSKQGIHHVVAKRAESTYRAGPCSSWVTVRCDEDAVTKLSSNEHSKSTSKLVRFTNRAKVLWPQDGLTKGDLIEYYGQIADCLLPYLQNRPLSLNRFPNGIDRESFFQKNTPTSAPDWLQTARLSASDEEKQVRYVLCNDRDTLCYLANLAAVELHPWSSTVSNPGSPDWAIIDLDPGSTPFSTVTRVARSVGKVLHGIGLRPYLKTSGRKGLHIYIPLISGYTYGQARSFCEGISRHIVNEHPEIATVERSVGQRGNRVYLDYMQNRRGQTIVAPYSVRPVAGACVSTPLDWDEISGDLHPKALTMHHTLARVERSGDLFSGALSDRQDLLPAIENLRQMLLE